MSTGEAPAARWRRFVATLVDVVVVFVTAFALMLVTGAYEHAEDYVGLRPVVTAVLLGAGAYLLPNAWMLHRRGQTIGKRLAGVAIVSASRGDVPALWVLLGRGLLFLALSLVDILFIFRADRRCLHDLICGTRVVNYRK